jgi:hypothetical protein
MIACNYNKFIETEYNYRLYYYLKLNNNTERLDKYINSVKYNNSLIKRYINLVQSTYTNTEYMNYLLIENDYKLTTYSEISATRKNIQTKIRIKLNGKIIINKDSIFN